MSKRRVKSKQCRDSRVSTMVDRPTTTGSLLKTPVEALKHNGAGSGGELTHMLANVDFGGSISSSLTNGRPP